MLLIDSDFGDVTRCSTYRDLMHVARTMISSRADVLTMDVAYNDACNYRSTVGHFITREPMAALYEAGHDPVGVLVEEFKNAGITTLAGYRVNDHHGSPSSWTPWEREHTEWSLGKETGAWREHKAVGDRGWREIGDMRQMDYAIKGVRTRRLALLQEIVTKYDVDGIQLDFGRSAPFLSEPKREKAYLLTQFVRDVRTMLDEVSAGGRRRLVLAAILPWDLDFCEREGLEVGRWIEEELVSYVSPGEWYYSDWNIPLTGWVELTRGTTCRLYPMTCTMVSSTTAISPGKRVFLGDDSQIFDGPTIRSLAETFYSQGAEGIMFYNFHVSKFENRYPLLRDWTDEAKIRSMTRHYYYARRLKYVPTEHYTFGLPDGYAPEEVEAFTPFPLMEAGDEIKYPFLFGSELGMSTAAFQFKLRDLGDADEVAVSLNGQGITPGDVVFRPYQPPDAPAFRFAVWQAALGTPPLKQGENVVQVKLLRRDPGRGSPIQAGEFEILVDPVDTP